MKRPKPGLPGPFPPPDDTETSTDDYAHTVRLESYHELQQIQDGVHHLVVVEGEHQGLRVEVADHPVRIGRGSDCEMRIADPMVSKYHCEVALSSLNLEVTDLDSTNGTYVEGVRLRRPALVHPESTMQIGSHLLRHEFRSRREFEQALELEGDLQRARSYVEGLLPRPLDRGAVTTEWCFEPSATLGGDLLGYQQLDEDHVAVHLLDVSGHGVGAAIHSASIHNAIRNPKLLRADARDPAAVLATLNDMFPMETCGDMFFTVWYGVYHVGQRRLEFASAGHPPALLLDPSAAELRQLRTRNPPVGVREDLSFRKEATDVCPDARLYLFSDGVFEIEDRDGNEQGFAEFEALVKARPPGSDSETARLRAAVRDACGRPQLEDDFSLLVVTFP